jgi:hypothetical protein
MASTAPGNYPDNNTHNTKGIKTNQYGKSHELGIAEAENIGSYQQYQNAVKRSQGNSQGRNITGTALCQLLVPVIVG